MSLKERRKSYETQDFFADISKYDSQIRSFVPSPSVHKSPEKAVSFRCSGNLLYSQKKYKDAVLIYNLVCQLLLHIVLVLNLQILFSIGYSERQVRREAE